MKAKRKSVMYRWGLYSGDRKVSLYRISGGVRNGTWTEISPTGERFTVRRAAQITKRLMADIAAYEK